MRAFLQKTPWQRPEFDIDLLAFASSEDLKIDGRFDSRVSCDEDIVPWVHSAYQKLEKTSFPYLCDGSIRRLYFLPTLCRNKLSDEQGIIVGVGEKKLSLRQTHCFLRYTEESSNESPEGFINNWINWSIHLFQEIANEKEVSGDNFSGIVRRSWGTVMRHIARDGNQDAMMSLIVQLADNKKLKNALNSIARNPRKVLKRVRQNMKLSRIQQLDGTCIRDYAHRPGFNAAEKAGAKQELLGVNRVENTNTLENRVAVWVLNAIEHYAEKYIRENSAFASSGRVAMVRRFKREATEMVRNSEMKMIGSEQLEHPVLPNYPLQFERRYKEVYAAYQKLRHDKKVFDDAWEWQRVLWGCSIRLLFYSVLLKLLKTPYSNHVYIKNESVGGRWLNRGDAPGPFSIDQKSWIYLIDSWDIQDAAGWLSTSEIFPGAHDIGKLGVDACLYCQNSQKLLLIWYVYDTHWDVSYYRKLLQSCQHAVAQFEQNQKAKGKFLSEIAGVMLVSSLGVNAGKNFCLEDTDSSSGTKVHMLLLSEEHRQLEHPILEKISQILRRLFS